MLGEVLFWIHELLLNSLRLSVEDLGLIPIDADDIYIYVYQLLVDILIKFQYK